MGNRGPAPPHRPEKERVEERRQEGVVEVGRGRVGSCIGAGGVARVRSWSWGRSSSEAI